MQQPRPPGERAPDDASLPGWAASDVVAVPAERLDSFRRYMYWTMVGVVLGMLGLYAVTGPVPYPPHPLGITGLVGLVVTGAAYARLTGHHIPPTAQAQPLTPQQWRAWAAAGVTGSLLVAATWAAGGDALFWAVAPAATTALVLASLPQRLRSPAAGAAVAVAAAAGLVIGVLRGDGQLAAFAASGAAVTAFLLFVTLTSIWTWDVAVQLDRARRTAATLAVANERLRFAADLHDIQGHHLQVIALKSELARRLVRADPDAAARETAAVQQLATDALRDTRAVVQGYRRVTLDTELANATAVLGSAGIDARLHLDPVVRADALPEADRHLLGLVVREAITNVLRHSSATRADITVRGEGRLRLAVANDGADGPGTHEGGLGDLAERLRAAGGALSWGHSGDQFEVRAELPTTGAPS